ncbi:MAG: benzoyl-CoA reductase subunit B [Myxococcaceae bacterium]|nr:benzoyl-CoA reductase subunit B [Myxococcaceae bacterium]
MTARPDAIKEDSMLLQKKMIAGHFDRLANTAKTGEKAVYTFVPGNLNELIWAFDLLPVHPEINALQSAMRKQSGDYVLEAEKAGHSEDVCTYVKSDIGMMRKGNIGPTGQRLPEPSLLLLSYTGCFTFMKWFELLKQEYNCPVVMLHVPYQADGRITPEMRKYVVKQLKEVVIPKLEEISGKKYDEDKLRAMLASSARSEDDLVAVWDAAKQKPSPIDAYFGGVYYIGPIFTAFRGTKECESYYRTLRAEVEQRAKQGLGPVTPDGKVHQEKYRLVVEGPPNWTSFREFWEMFYAEGAVCVSSTYTRVGGLYEQGFRHDPEHPLESLADYCMGCYTNRNLPSRVDLIAKQIEDFQADGFVVNSIKSCNSFSAGQLLMMKEIEKRTGRAGGFIESDLVDPRYFSAANIKNRLESYFQMLEARS